MPAVTRWEGRGYKDMEGEGEDSVCLCNYADLVLQTGMDANSNNCYCLQMCNQGGGNRDASDNILDLIL